MTYQWDRDKALANRQKHGIEFADAIGVLENQQALTIEDVDSGGEQRFITLGLDFLGRLLVVVYTYRRSRYALYQPARPPKRK